MFRLVSASLAGLALGEELTMSTFDDAVFNSGKNSIVKFLAPW